jgi:hypothetical protein
VVTVVGHQLTEKAAAMESTGNTGVRTNYRVSIKPFSDYKLQIFLIRESIYAHPVGLGHHAIVCCKSMKKSLQDCVC